MKITLVLSAFSLFMASCAMHKNPSNGSFNNLNNRTMTNISSFHEATKPVSAKPFFKGPEGTVAALQIKKDGLLDKHITKVEALLVCVAGEVVFENEKGFKQTLARMAILSKSKPQVMHWVKGVQDSQLLLIK